MEEKKSLGKELQEKLTFTQPHIADEQPDAVAEAERFCVDYKAFLDAAKTEREAAAEVERRALAAGYRPMQRTGVTYKTGDKVFYNNRGKAMLLATLGKRPLDEGVRLMVAHIDSPARCSVPQGRHQGGSPPGRGSGRPCVLRDGPAASPGRRAE